MLIEAGADCNQQSVGDQYSPLHVAAKNGNHLVGVALVMAGCGVDLTDNNGLAVTTTTTTRRLPLAQRLRTLSRRLVVCGVALQALDIAEDEGYTGDYEFVGKVEDAMEAKFLQDVRGHTLSRFRAFVEFVFRLRPFASRLVADEKRMGQMDESATGKGEEHLQEEL